MLPENFQNILRRSIRFSEYRSPVLQQPSHTDRPFQSCWCESHYRSTISHILSNNIGILCPSDGLTLAVFATECGLWPSSEHRALRPVPMSYSDHSQQASVIRARYANPSFKEIYVISPAHKRCVRSRPKPRIRFEYLHPAPRAGRKLFLPTFD